MTFRDALAQHQRSVKDRLIMNMEPQIRRIPVNEQIPFVWRVLARASPQVCYDLASYLLS